MKLDRVVIAQEQRFAVLYPELTLPCNYNRLDQPTRRAVREEYVRLQAGKCHHCGQHLQGPAAQHVRDRSVNDNLFPPNFFSWPIHLHHNHQTGLTIGAVHALCNAVLWQYHGE